MIRKCFSISAAYCAAASSASQQAVVFGSPQQPAGGPLGQHGLGSPQQPTGASSAQHGFGQSGGHGFPQQLPSAFSPSDAMAHVAESAFAVGQPPQPDAGQAPTAGVVSVSAGSLLVKPPNKTDPTSNATTTPPTIIKFF